MSSVHNRKVRLRPCAFRYPLAKAYEISTQDTPNSLRLNAQRPRSSWVCRRSLTVNSTVNWPVGKCNGRIQNLVRYAARHRITNKTRWSILNCVKHPISCSNNFSFCSYMTRTYPRATAAPNARATNTLAGNTLLKQSAVSSAGWLYWQKPS